MKLSDFHYYLPEELIAQYPLEKRDQARLLVVDRIKKTISHDIFANVCKYLPKDSIVVLNDTKVVAARLLGKRIPTGGQFEIFLLKQLKGKNEFETLIKPLRRLKENDQVEFEEGLTAQLIDKEKRIVRFNTNHIYEKLERIGHMSLPPYIKRKDETLDHKRYQTVFAKHRGSVAAPTAGLHFTKELLAKIKKEGHTLLPVTLHVNYATFKPVEVEDIRKHPMHSEEYLIDQKNYQRILRSRVKGQKIVAVGTTSCRVLETVASSGRLKGETDIFIYPPYPFKMADMLITNFHLPQSTLLMLVYAFGGQELIKRAYQEAIDKKYRFFSYGDAMIII